MGKESAGRSNGGGEGCHDGGCGDGRNCNRGRLSPDSQAERDTDHRHGEGDDQPDVHEPQESEGSRSRRNGRQKQLGT
jgi:hypothetical protein